MRLVQVLPPDANPTAQELADGLYALNSMLDSWTLERLFVYQVEQTERAWPAVAASRTIGNEGNYDTSRPSKVDPKGNFFRDANGYDYPVTVIDRQTFDCFAYKNAPGYPEYLAVDPGFPLMTLFAYPIPSAAMTLHLNTWALLPQFGAGTEQLLLPAGYQRAIEYALAIEIAPEFGGPAMRAAAAIAKPAALAKAVIKSANTPSMVAQLDLPAAGQRSRILTDG